MKKCISENAESYNLKCLSKKKKKSVKYGGMPQDSLKSLVQEHTPVHVCQLPLKPHLPSLQLSALSIFKCLQFPKNIIFFHTLTSALPCTASLLGTLLSSQLNCDFPTASSVPSDLSHADLYLGVPLQFVDLCVSLLTSKTT